MPADTQSPISDFSHRLGNWWRRSAKPALGGLSGGFALAMLATGAAEALGVASRSNAFDNIAVFSWLLGGMAIYGLMRRAAFAHETTHGRQRVRQEQAAGKLTPEQALRSQLDRIAMKARRLHKLARQDAGVYSSLATAAPELERQARELAARALHLQAAAQTIGAGRPRTSAEAPGLSPAAPDAVLQREYEAAQATQHRVGELLVENGAQQRLCLTRLERIEDLLDAAWLELSQAADGATASATNPAIVQEVETELRAAREAVQVVADETRGEAEVA